MLVEKEMQNARVVRGVPWQGVTLAFELALPSMGGARGVLARAGRCPRADPALVGLAGRGCGGQCPLHDAPACQ